MGIVLLLEACSSGYQPARSPRIATVMEGGSLTLVRDGKSYPVGIFGTGIEDAVEGNAVAEEHAHAYRNLTIAGISTSVVGLGTEIGGLVVAGNTWGGRGDSGSQAAGAALVLTGLAAVLAGAVLLANAQPRLWDAVNTYNDGIDASWRGPPFMPPPAAPLGPAGGAPPVPDGAAVSSPNPSESKAPSPRGTPAPPATSTRPAAPSAAFPE